MNKFTKLLQNIFLSDKLTLLIRITLILAIIEGLLVMSFFNIFICLLAYILTYSHLYIEKKYSVKLSKGLQIIIILFVFCSLFLGEIHGYYTKFSWWDTLLHGFSGLALGFVGFLIMYIFYKSGKYKLPIILICIFSFSFGLGLGALWEIFEYLVDEILGANMQKARHLELIYDAFDTRLGVQDTMQDLIIDAIGSFIASISGYIYLKNGEGIKWFHIMVKGFENVNKPLFKK